MDIVKSKDYGNLHFEFFENIISDNTRISYKTDIKQFYNFLRYKFPDLDGPLSVSIPHVIEYRNELQLLKYSSKSVVRKLASVSHFYKFLIEKGLLLHNPVASIQRPSANADRPHDGLDNTEAEMFLSELDKMKINSEVVAVYLLFSTGIRREEVVNVRLRDFSVFEGDRFLKVVGKGGKLVHKFIPKWMWEKIQSLVNLHKSAGVPISEDSYIFIHKYSGEYGQINSKKIYRLIKNTTSKLGINKNISTHSVRVTYITAALDSGMPAHKVQQDVGHADIKTTLSYNRKRKSLKETPVNGIDFLKRSG